MQGVAELKVKAQASTLRGRWSLSKKEKANGGKSAERPPQDLNKRGRDRIWSHRKTASKGLFRS